MLPPEYDEVVDDDDLDVTAEIATATVEIGLRSRSSRVTWMAPSTHDVSVVDTVDGSVAFDVSVRAIIDPDAVVFGRPLEDGLWDLNVRCTLAGSATQQRMRSALEPSASVQGGRVQLIYTNADGTLTLSLGRAQDAVARLLPAAHAAVMRSEGGRTVLTVPLEGVEVAGEARFDVTIPVAQGKLPRTDRAVRESDFGSVPAQLVAAGGRLMIELDLPDGRRPWLLRIGADHPRGREWWSLGDEMTPGPPRAEQRRAPGRTSLWRRVGSRAEGGCSTTAARIVLPAASAVDRVSQQPHCAGT